MAETQLGTLARLGVIQQGAPLSRSIDAFRHARLVIFPTEVIGVVKQDPESTIVGSSGDTGRPKTRHDVRLATTKLFCLNLTTDSTNASQVTITEVR